MSDKRAGDDFARHVSLDGGLPPITPVPFGPPTPRKDIPRRPVADIGKEREQAELIAERFHAEYERLAPLFGYETRPESAVPWDDVPEDNRRLMLAVVGELLALGDIYAPSTLQAQSAELDAARAERDRWKDLANSAIVEMGRAPLERHRLFYWGELKSRRAHLLTSTQPEPSATVMVDVERDDGTIVKYEIPRRSVSEAMAQRRAGRPPEAPT